MNISHGLNIDEVERLARLLAVASGDMGLVVSKVAAALATTSWQGNDFREVERNWQTHRTAIAEAAQFLANASQIASNLARDQRAASGV